VAAEKKDRPELSFGVIADPQYADQPTKGSRHYRQSLGKLKTCIHELNSEALDFVVTLGDIIDRDFESFSEIIPIYAGLKIPHEVVLGNHDYSVADADKEKVLGVLGLKAAYRSEVRGKWRFIYLDGMDVSVERYPKSDPRTKTAMKMMQKLKKSGVKQAVPWNGALGEKQLAWLKVELDTSKKANQRVMIFCHFPLQPSGEGHTLWNSTEIVELLDGYDHVVSYMNGHKHSGDYHLHKGCHYVNFKGMVETGNKSAYAIVRCFADRVEIDGYDTEPDRVLG